MLILQAVVDIGLNTRVELFGRLRRIPAQLPATLALRTRVGSHLHENELVRLWIQICFAQLNCLRRHYLPARVKSLGDHFDNSQLLVLSALKEIESVATGSWLFSGYDRVKEDAVEFADLTYFKLCQFASGCTE